MDSNTIATATIINIKRNSFIVFYYICTGLKQFATHLRKRRSQSGFAHSHY